MSYSFDGTNDTLAGALTSTYDAPITMACWFKWGGGGAGAHPSAIDAMVNFGNSSSSATSSYILRTQATVDRFEIYADGATADETTSLAKTVAADTWTPFIGVVTSHSVRDVYVSDVTNGEASGTEDVATALQYVRLGENFAAANDFYGLLAEVAIWNKALSAGEIASYLAGNDPSGIAAANLIGYWPLSADNATQSNQGVDAGGDLSVTSAVYNSDHPTISGTSALTAQQVQFYRRPNPLLRM